MKNLKIKKLTETAQLPKRENFSDAGYDLYSDEDILIPKGKIKIISTGIAIQIPNSEEDEGIKLYGRIAPRSGLAAKHGIDVFAGVIDEGYIGEIKVVLFNAGINNYQVKKGDRIAQLIITPILTPEIEIVDELKETSRGEKGFGSSGK